MDTYFMAELYLINIPLTTLVNIVDMSSLQNKWDFIEIH